MFQIQTPPRVFGVTIMQLSRALIIASYLSIFLCFITSDTSATRGARSTAEPGIGTHQQGQDKVVAATTRAFGLGESDRHSAMATRLSTLPMALLAPPQGALTNQRWRGIGERVLSAVTINGY